MVVQNWYPDSSRIFHPSYPSNGKLTDTCSPPSSSTVLDKPPMPENFSANSNFLIPLTLSLASVLAPSCRTDASGHPSSVHLHLFVICPFQRAQRPLDSSCAGGSGRSPSSTGSSVSCGSCMTQDMFLWPPPLCDGGGLAAAFF